MQQEADNLLKETTRELRNQKIINFFHKNKFIILVIALIIVIGCISYAIYQSHLTSVANKNSVIFSQVQQELNQGNEPKALELLNQLSTNGTNGYKLVSAFQKASLSIHNQNYDDAIKQLNVINKLRVPGYYKDMANSIIFSIRLDNDKDIKTLLADLQANLNKHDTFYYSNLEMYSIALMETKDYNKALDTTNQIINADDAPAGIKQRAKGLKSVILAYVK
ncbi:tetratricopeptide repeat protein [Rickettsiales bacterium LUAb2]